MKFSTLSLVLSLTLLVSCGGSGSGGGSKGKKSQSQANTVENGQGAGTETSASSNLKQVYKGKCAYLSDLQTYGRTVAEISTKNGETEMTLRDDYYDRDDHYCSRGMVFSLETKVPQFSQIEGLKMEGDTDGFYYRPQSKLAAQAMNQTGLCGYYNWRVNVPQRITVDCIPDVEDNTLFVEFNSTKTMAVISVCDLGATNSLSCTKIYLSKN